MAIWGQVRIIISTRLWGRGTVATEIGFLYFLLWNFEVLCKDPIPRAGRSLIFGWHSLHACTRAYVRRIMRASRTRVLQLTTRHLGKTQPKTPRLASLVSRVPHSTRPTASFQSSVNRKSNWRNGVAHARPACWSSHDARFRYEIGRQ